MKKSYLIIFVVLIIGVVSIFLFKDKINKDNTNKPPKEEVKNEEYYVYGIDKVIYNDGTNWSFIKPETVNWKSFKVYDNNGYAGTYYLQFNKRWYLFDEDRMSYKYTAPLFAYSGSAELNVNDNYEDFTESDIVELESLLKEKNVGDYGELTYKKKISLSSDSTIYVATNIYTSIKDYVFTIAYIKDKNGIKVLEEFFGNIDEELSMPSYYFEKTFRTSDNSNYKIMLLKTYFGNSANDCNIMYEINSNGSKKILDCDKIYSGEEKFVDKEEETVEKKTPIVLYVGIGLLCAVVIFLIFITIKNSKANRL